MITVINFERPQTVMDPTIALYHRGVGAMVSSLSFFFNGFVASSFLRVRLQLNSYIAELCLIGRCGNKRYTATTTNIGD